MKIFTTKKELRDHLLSIRNSKKTIGFVPTMGALHKGHLSLIEQAQQYNDVVVCSIFVNPTQFNDPADLEKYPRPIEQDIYKLQQAGVDVLFNPGVDEIYDDNEQWHLNLGEMEHLLEGKFRPGHYQGVTQVVYKLFNIVNPDDAYFGQKDYQQFLVIKQMVELKQLPVNLIMCPIQRDEDGLAMSSRNIHLSADDRQHALVLSKALSYAVQNFSGDNIDDIKHMAETMINTEPGAELEYFEMADGLTLHPANQQTSVIVALVSARVGKTRLIDKKKKKN